MECVSYFFLVNFISLCWWLFCRYIIFWILYSLRLWKCRLVVFKFDVILLEFILMLVGFFMYKVVIFVEMFKEIFLKFEEDDSDIWDCFGFIYYFFFLYIYCEGKFNVFLLLFYNLFCCVFLCYGLVVVELFFCFLFGYWRIWGLVYIKVFNLCFLFECIDLLCFIFYIECNI